MHVEYQQAEIYQKLEFTAEVEAKIRHLPASENPEAFGWASVFFGGDDMIERSEAVFLPGDIIQELKEQGAKPHQVFALEVAENTDDRFNVDRYSKYGHVAYYARYVLYDD